MKENYNSRQLRALTFLAFLVPVMRLVPKYTAEVAGSGAYLAPVIALPLILLYIYFLSSLLRSRNDGEGLGEMLLKTGGSFFGRAVLGITWVFSLFYCSFVLRSGADRYISTVYPASGPWVFVFVMLALALIAALGRKTALVRTAKIFSPMLLFVLIPVLAFSFTMADFRLLRPINENGTAALIKSAFPVLNVSIGMLAYSAFLEGGCEKDRYRAKNYILWFLPVCVLISVIIAAIIGNYGAPLTAELSHPFFTMIRDVRLFNTLERLEALMLALWVLPDFIVSTLMMFVAAYSALLCFGLKPSLGKKLNNGRWIILVNAAIIAAVAVLLPSDERKMLMLSEVYVPIGNLILTAGLYPLCFLIGKLKNVRKFPQ